MTDFGPQGRYRPSLSAPTPRGVSAGKMGKCVTALRPRFRPARYFSSRPVCTHDAGAHEPTAVRRHFALGASGWRTTLAGCAFAWAASAFVLVRRWRLSHALIVVREHQYGKCINEHDHCPKCRRWTCVVYLPDGSLRCNKCRIEWRPERHPPNR